MRAKLGSSNYPSSYNVYDFGQSQSIRLVIYNHAQTGSHPMHMHGHNMYILQEGVGTWDGSVVHAANPHGTSAAQCFDVLNCENEGQKGGVKDCRGRHVIV